MENEEERRKVMYTADVTGAQVLLTYSDIYKNEKPDLIESIKSINMHKAISVICELLRVRDSYMEPVRTIEYLLKQ